MFVSTLKLALVNIVANKKQSALTMLGVIIGIASVITIISLGSGAQSLITNTITDFGTNIMAVIPGKTEEGGGPPPIARGIIITTLKKRDAEKIRLIHEIDSLYPIVIGNAITTYENESESLSYFGVGYQFLRVHDFEIGEGRFFSKREEDSIARVVVLGIEAKRKLFGDVDAIGKTIKIEQRSFQVVGILEPLGSVFGLDQDNQIYLPVSTVQKQLQGMDYYHVIRLKAKNKNDLDVIKTQITQMLRKTHSIHDPKNDDFSIQTQEQALETLGSVTQALKLFLAAIAGISLIVGGVGIMNMMLVTVTRRTKEIGLRKAIGAKKRDIIFQFMIEAALITLIGGVIGIFFGSAFSALVALGMQSLEYSWDFIISLSSILLATGISLAIGVIFGVYPSVKAASLNPIDALRYE